MAPYLFIFLCVALCQAENFKISKIPWQSSLHYESLGKVHFIKNHWELVTFIDVKKLETERPEVPFEMLENVNNTCKYYGDPQTCIKILNDENLLKKHQQVEGYLDKLRTLTDVQGKKLSSPLDLESLSSSKVYKSLTGVIQVELHPVHEKLDNFMNQTAISFSFVDEFFKGIDSSNNGTDLFMINHKIAAWVKDLEKSQDNYIYALHNAIEAIYLARTGLIHPEFFELKKLGILAENFLKEEEKNGVIFPLSMEEIYSGGLLKVASTNIIYKQGKLVVVLDIPLLNPPPFKLYRIHPYPTFQKFGNKEGSAFIQPRADYLITSQDHYTLSKDMSECRFMNDIYICESKYPMYDVNYQPTCEVAIISKKRRPDRFRDCNIRVSSIFNSHWTPIRNGWLYSIPGREQLEIFCDNKWMETVNITGAGIFQIQSGCYADTHYSLLIGHGNISDVEDVFSMKLNVTLLAPALKNVRELSRKYFFIWEVINEMKRSEYNEKIHGNLRSKIFIIVIAQSILTVVLLIRLPATRNRKYIIPIGVRETRV